MAKVGRPRKVKNELITRQSSIDNLSLLDRFNDPDVVLEKLGLDADTAFRDTLNDDHLTSVMGTRKAAIKGMDWDLTVGDSDDRILEASELMLKNINRSSQGMGLDRLIEDTLEAVPWGMSACEVIWQIGPNEWTPIEVKGRPFRYFTFNNNNELQFLSRESGYNGVDVPPHKVLLARHWITTNSFENPYGDKLLSKSYWPILFKRNAMMWSNTFLEKYGMPLLVGKVPNGMSESDRQAFADILANTVQDGVVVSSEQNEIELVEGDKKSSSAAYIEIMNFMNSAISKVWLGQTLTTEMTNNTGSYAASKTHQGVKDERTMQDKIMVENNIQTLVDWFVLKNFGENAKSPVFSLVEALGVKADQAIRDKDLKDTGVKFSKTYYMKEYGLEEEDFELTEDVKEPVEPVGPMEDKTKPNGPNPKTPNTNEDPNTEKKEDGKLSKASRDREQDSVDAIIDNLDPVALQAQAEGMLQPVIKLIREAKSYEEIMENLVGTYPEMKTESLQDMLTRSMFVSEAIARLSNA